ncbi:MAG: DUF998 domain-containing protein [Candidatus Bathyarchaeota archaeon]|nr:DUF998 domain-containing protein [Candidatus Bathyarchaeota archaeon]MDH5786795.1 DUF998 domain-containing protein [Candidatus Bathyarchaeota archaeon]
MNSRSTVWLRIAGICGIIAPLIAFTFILLAITYSPQFSWIENALSDLGIQEGATGILFNSGLIIGGILALTFASGVFIFLYEKFLGRTGALVFLSASLALIAIGVFPENARPMHYYASAAFFALSSVAMIVIGVAFLLMARLKMGVFTFLAATIAVTVWIAQFTTRFVTGVAIPEAVSALSTSMWAIVLAFKMLKQA